MPPLIRLLALVALTTAAPAAIAFEPAKPAEDRLQVDTRGLPPLPPGPPDENPYRGNPEVAAIGRAVFNQTCARCHGVDAVSKQLHGPDLTRLDRACLRIADPAVKALCIADNDAYFLDSALNGKVRVGVTHMPAWKDVLSLPQLWAVRTFLEQRRTPAKE